MKARRMTEKSAVRRVVSRYALKVQLDLALLQIPV